MEIHLNGWNLGGILDGAPRVTDQLNAICRMFEFSIRKTESLDNYLGQSVEFWYNGQRWFKGDLRRRGYRSDRNVTYLVYDPLFYLTKNSDDYYFRNSTATQDFREVCEKVGIRVANLENTRAILPPCYYENAVADEVLIDRLARTKSMNNLNFWFRYDPVKDGVILFERKVPTEVWAFRTGESGTLTYAEQEESVEDTISVVELINRDTGKKVTKINSEALKAYGHTVHREEVSKEEVSGMETKANTLLSSLSKVTVSMKVEAINPNIMPQFFSGDVIYCEERNSGLVGGYYIRNVTHTFNSDNLVTLSFDLTATPDVPTIQYEDAAAAGSKKAKSSNKGKGVQETYSAEVKKLMEKYGI